MKYLVLIGDGMADFPLDACGGKTPLETAATPAMDAVTASGITGLFNPIPDGFPAGSDIGNLSLFGYDPHLTFTGRAPLEAINQGISLHENEIAFRCNLVTLADGKMEDFTAGHISSEEAAELIDGLNKHFSGEPVQFHSGVSYRHLAVVSGGECSPDDLASLKCTPPHDITDEAYSSHVPRGPGSDFICDLMDRSQGLLREHPVNAVRGRAGKAKATSIWLWGQGRSPRMETYQQRFNISGAVVSAVDLINGIGRAAGLEVLTVEGATGYLDTNYDGKVEAALDALKAMDFCYLHIEAPDEASHEGRVDLKLQAIEDFDAKVVAPCLKFAQAHGDCRVLVAPDHITSIASKTHAGGPVPFALCGPGVEGTGAVKYHEAAAHETGIAVEKGHTLVPHMVTAEKVTAESLNTLVNIL